MSDKTKKPEIDGPDAEHGQRAVDWALAVMWAAENLNVARMTKRKAGSLMKYALWQFGREDPKTLVSQLSFKAAQILEKNKRENEETLIVEQEKKSIAELEELLADAKTEAGI